MDARTSRYHEVYARWQRDPQGFWGEAAQAIDWIEPPEAGVRSRRGRLRALVRRRRLQHLLERGRPPRRCRAAASRRRSSTIRRSPDRSAPSPTTGCRPRRRCSPASCATSASTRAIASSSTCRWCRRRSIGDARLRAHRRGAFGGVRRLRGERARHPHRRRQAEGDPVRELRPRARPHRQVQAAARRGDRARRPQARRLSHPAAAAGGGDARRPAATTTGPRRATRRSCRALGLRLRAGRRHRSALHPLHVRHDRPAEGRRARQRRPHGRAQMVDAEPLRRRAGRGLLGGLRHRLGGRPQLHRLRRRCCTAAPRSSTKASRSARPTPARSGG